MKKPSLTTNELNMLVTLEQHKTIRWIDTVRASDTAMLNRLVNKGYATWNEKDREWTANV